MDGKPGGAVRTLAVLNLNSVASMASTFAEVLGSPTAVAAFGVTTLVLLGTTYFLARSSGDDDGGAGQKAGADGSEADGPAERPALDRAKYPGGYLTIYYGSQTGTAQMFAKQVASECESRGFCPRTVDLQDVIENDDFREGEPPEAAPFEDVDEDGRLIRATLADPHYRDGDGGERSKALFFMATYGEGEPTDNAQPFVEAMKGKSGISNIYKIVVSAASTNEADDASPRDASFLSDLDYAVFGLGNKQYEHYNNMSRFTDAALEECGARRIAPLGLGDDDDDLEGDFETWKDDVLWPALTERYLKDKGNMTDGGEGEEKKEEDLAPSLPPCPYRVEYLMDEGGEVSNGVPIQTSSKHYTQSWDCPVVAKRELRDPSDPGSTLHMEIDISKHMDTCRYLTADNLGILPKNDPSMVEAVAKALNYDLDQRFHLQPNDSDESSKHTLPFPTPCTVRECLARYCDLAGPPRRSDLKQLAPYARSDIDRKALLRLSSKEGKAEYKEKVVEAHVGIGDILTRLCPSIECPLEHFVGVCPRLQPRYYTISSSSTMHPETIHITLAVLETERKDGTVFRGVCTGHLAGLNVGDMARVFVRDSTFRLPKQVERPVLMFGPGTGIAPMRAVLQERSHGRKTGADHGPSILYFGCKDRSKDYLYRDELESFKEEGTLTELHLAFSREQAEKVYVQHLLAKRGRATWEMIHDRKASVFVCGAVKMGADVDHALQDIISKEGGMTREEAKAYLDRLAVAGRFVQELWS